MEKKLISIEREDEGFLDFQHIIYYIHGSCMFNCDYCFTINNRRKNRDLDNQKKIIDTFLKLKDRFEIYFYGGEPTEYIFLPDVIDYINQNKTDKFYRMQLQTNLNVSTDYIKNLCNKDNIIVSPSLHISYLRGDSIYDLIEKIDILYDNNRLERIDFMLEKGNIDKHYELNDLLTAKPYKDKLMYTFNYMEINKQDKYTGAHNTYETYKDIIDNHHTQERYKLSYDDGSSETLDISEMYTRDISFKGWNCDAGRRLMYVEFNGDWWVCDTKNMKESPQGNILKNPAKFLIQSYAGVKCNVDKCDGCYYIAKTKS